MNTLSMSIGENAIRQDAEGRYCLNDLHRAAGGEPRHRPKNWLENQQTRNLIAELEIGGIPPIESKQGLGTFVAKELVYAYAMWISAAFYLKVIRSYDALVNQLASPAMGPWVELMQLEVENRSSFVRGQYGSHLMHGRRAELRRIRPRLAELIRRIQPQLQFPGGVA